MRILSHENLLGRTVKMGAIHGEELNKSGKTLGREERILVLVRLRPLSEKELSNNEVTDWECINESTVLYRNSLQERSGLPTAYSYGEQLKHDFLECWP